MATIDPNKLTEEQARQNLAASNVSQTPAQREQAVLDYSATQPGQTVSYAPATGGQTFQAYTSTDASRRDAGIQEVARLNNISLSEAAKRYDRGTASQAGAVTPPPGTVYNPATGKAYDPLSGMEYAGSTGPNFQGMRFVDPGTQGFMGTGMSGQQTGLPAGTAMGVPAGASGAAQGQVTEDPEMAFWRTQQEQAKLRLNQTQAALNQQFEQMRREREAQQKSQQGQTSMQLARMGAFSAASGVSYGAALQSRHANELQQLEMERQNALLKAQNEADEVGLKFAMKSLERAKELKVEQQKLADRQMQDVERYKKLQAIEKEDLALTMQGMIDGGMTLDDLPEDYLKTKYPNIDDFTAKALFSSVQKVQMAKQSKDELEQQKFALEASKDIYNMLDKIPAGQEVRIMGNTYFGTQGAGKIEIDEDGIGRSLIIDPVTGEPRVKNYGKLGKAEPGSFEITYDEVTGESFIFNKKEGKYQNAGDDYQISERWSQMIPEGKKGGQCGTFVRQLTGLADPKTGRIPNSVEGKVALCDPALKRDPSRIQPGMTFVMSTNKPWGHIGIINAVDRLPNGRVQLTLTESNWKEDERVSHTRKMYLDDPRLLGFADTRGGLPREMIEEGYKPPTAAEVQGPRKLSLRDKQALEEQKTRQEFERKKEFETFKVGLKQKAGVRTITRTDPETGETITEEVAPTGKALPTTDVRLLSEGGQLGIVLDPLENIINENEDLFGPFAGRTIAQNPYGKGAKLEDDFKRAAQVIGKFMEGGVLRKEDEEKYRGMLPSMKDTPDVARNKLEGVRKLVEEKRKQYIQDYEAAGYDVSGFAKEKKMTPTTSILEKIKGNEALKEKVKKAREAGYSDQEIAAKLGIK